MTEVSPEILPVEQEREILFQRLIDAMGPGKLALRPELTVAEGWDAIAGMAVTGVLRRLRVMSARQLAVLLAGEANGGEGWVIREPPHYTAEEIADLLLASPHRRETRDAPWVACSFVRPVLFVRHHLEVEAAPPRPGIPRDASRLEVSARSQPSRSR